MFTVIIPTQNDEQRLVPTLTALVPGAASGLLRDVIVADGGSQDATLRVAESAGCEIVVSPQELGGRLRAAAARARASWLMFLRPGCILDATWLDESERFLSQAEPIDPLRQPAAVFRPAARLGQARPLLVEAMALLHASLGAQPRPEQGLIVSKARYDALGGHGESEAEPERAFIRRLGSRNLIVLRCGAVMMQSG
jgi:hypothetical protein